MIGAQTLSQIEQVIAQFRRPGDFGDEAVEIEVRFGLHFSSKKAGTGFTSGVSGRTFARVRADSMKLDPKFSFSHTRDEYFDTSEDRYSSLLDINGVVQQTYHLRKSRSHPFDFPDYFFRIGISREDQDNAPRPSGPAKTVREKKRWSFLLTSRGDFRLDLTEVTTYLPPNIRDGKTSYEIELEIIRDKIQNLRGLNSFLGSLLQKIMGTRLLYTAKERAEVIDRINEALGSITRVPGVIDINTLAQVRNLKFHDMVHGGIIPKTDKDIRYTVTIKADGLRRLFVILPLGIYLVYPPNDVNKLFGDKVAQDLTTSWHGSIFEGEVIPVEKVSETASEAYRKAKLRLHFYDCLAIQNESQRIRKLSHMERLTFLDKLLPAFDKYEGAGFIMKKKDFIKFQTAPQFYQAVTQLLDLDHPFLTDGLIFTPDNYGYDSEFASKIPDLTKNPDIVKWKELITIDFQIRHVVDVSGNYVDLLVSQRGEKVPFTGNSMIPFSSKGGVLLTDAVRYSLPDSIAEFKWNGNQFEYIQSRNDKIIPNSMRVARDDWKDIHDPITEKVMRGQEFRLLRKYHNREKKILFNFVGKELPVLIGPPFTSRTLLDIGSGQGGDLSKYKASGFTHLILVEPDGKNREELISRLDTQNAQESDPTKRMQYRIVPTVAQDLQTIIQTVREFAPKKRVDVISYMLSLSFFFKDAQSISSIRTLTQEVLDPGGYFIAFTIDGRKVLQLFQTPGRFEIINGTYRANLPPIDFELRQPTPSIPAHHIFINIPESIVKDQIEYLTNIPEIDGLLNNIGVIKVRETDATGEQFMTESELIFSSLFTSLIYKRN